MANIQILLLVLLMQLLGLFSGKAPDPDLQPITNDTVTESEPYQGETPESTEESIQPSRMMFVNVDELNVRDRGDFSSNVIGTLLYGESAEVISIDDGWATIQYQGGEAFVFAEYLSDSVAPQEQAETIDETEPSLPDVAEPADPDIPETVGMDVTVPEEITLEWIIQQADYLYLDIGQWNPERLTPYYLVPKDNNEFYDCYDLQGNIVSTIEYTSAKTIIDRLLGDIEYHQSLPQTGGYAVLVWESPYGLCAYSKYYHDYYPIVIPADSPGGPGAIEQDIASFSYILDEERVKAELQMFDVPEDIVIPYSEKTD